MDLFFELSQQPERDTKSRRPELGHYLEWVLNQGLTVRLEQDPKDSNDNHSHCGSHPTATAFVNEKKIRTQINRQLDGLGFTSI